MQQIVSAVLHNYVVQQTMCQVQSSAAVITADFSSGSVSCALCSAFTEQTHMCICSMIQLATVPYLGPIELQSHAERCTA